MSTVERAYEEIIDFFARGSTSMEVLQFRPSTAAQQRARYLLERSKSGELTPDEAVELERLGDVEHLMQLVKARAPFTRRPNCEFDLSRDVHWTCDGEAAQVEPRRASRSAEAARETGPPSASTVRRISKSASSMLPNTPPIRTSSGASTTRFVESAGTDLEVRTVKPSSRSPRGVFVDHELDECCGKLMSRVFVSLRAIRGCPTRTIPNPDEGRMSSRPRCPPTVLLLRASSFVIPSSLGISSFVLFLQGRPPAASNPWLCVATASRYPSCSAALRAPPPFELRASCFVIPSSFVIRHSSFPPVVAKKNHPLGLSPRGVATWRHQPGFVIRASSFLRAWVFRASCFSSRAGRLARPGFHFGQGKLPISLRYASPQMLSHGRVSPDRNRASLAAHKTCWINCSI